MVRIHPAAGFLFSIALFLLAAGVAVFLGHPQVATGILWGGFLGELNLRLLRWRIARSRPGSPRSLSIRLGSAFFLRYLIIILGFWIGHAAARANIPAMLLAFIAAFALAVARSLRR